MRNDIYLKEMGSKVKAARKAQKISLEKMWFLENGRRNAHTLTLKAIGDVLKMEVKDFI